MILGPFKKSYQENDYKLFNLYVWTIFGIKKSTMVDMSKKKNKPKPNQHSTNLHIV